MNANRYVLRPATDRAVQRIPGPHLVRPGRLEPAEHLRAARRRQRRGPSAPAGQTAAATCTPTATSRCWPAGSGDLRGGALRVLPLQRRRQLQHLARGPRAGLAAATGPAPRTRRPGRPGSTGGCVCSDTRTSCPSGPAMGRGRPARGPARRAARPTGADRSPPGSAEYRNSPDQPGPLQPPPLVRFLNCVSHLCPPQGSGCGHGRTEGDRQARGSAAEGNWC